MDFWIGVVGLAVGLMISIALHEVGHLLPAKRFGVKVPQYFVGFGPTLWSRRRGETEYGVKAVPLGGFVRMIGMFPPARTAAADPDARAEERLRRRGLRGWVSNVADDARAASAEEVAPGEEGRTFYALSTPKKLAVMFGGPVVNLILSALLIGIVLVGIGLPVATSTLATVSSCALPAGQARDCTSEDPAAPAVAAGFEPGDVVVSWGGTPTADWAEVSAAIRAGGTDPTTVVVDRDGERVDLTVTPVLVERATYDDTGRPVTGADGAPVTEAVPFVGISALQERQRQSPALVPPLVGQQLTATVGIVVTLPQRLVGIANAVFGDGERDPNVVGLVGAGRVAGELSQESAPQGFLAQLSNILLVLASLNMALFVFNMIPLPPLDGGHIAGALYEGARRQVARWRRRPTFGFADTARLMPLTYGVLVLMLGMFVLLLIADVVDPVSLL